MGSLVLNVADFYLGPAVTLRSADDEDRLGAMLPDLPR
jgi:hypothetical protein